MNLCKNIILLLLIVSFARTACGQVPPMLPNVYIFQHTDEAVNQMLNYKIPASVILAQAIFESNCGNSVLAKKSNNHFGIKCHLEWGGDTVVKTDDTLNECFRRYNSIADSYTDHSLFLKSRSRYAHLFNLEVTDYKGWCYGLKNAGYATYSCYAEELMKIIETNKLYDLDRAETIESARYICFKIFDVKPSNFNNLCSAFSKNCSVELLFSDEKDVLIQSVNLLLQQFEEEEEALDIAGNATH
jgi:hypothetical protein